MEPLDRDIPAGPADFRLMAHLFATAIEEADTGPVKEAVANAARRLGEVVGHDMRSRHEFTDGLQGEVAVVEDVLRSYGFQPTRVGDEVRLVTCPFHALAQEHMVLVCGANLAFVDGLVAALDAARVEVRLDPEDGRCCVVLGVAGDDPQYRGG